LILNALGIIVHENAQTTRQENHPVRQQEFTWFFALFHQKQAQVRSPAIDANEPPDSSVSRAVRRAGPWLLVLAVALVSSLPTWWAPVRWSGDPDSLYYQAKVLKFWGENEREALHKLFAGPQGSGLRELEERRRPARRQFTNANWIDYSSRFFRRRVFVPLLAASLYPVFDDRSLLTVSLLGYLLLSLALYALLRRRFSSNVSAIVSCICMLSPPLRQSSFIPMSDSWSILLETCALLTAVLTLQRGMRWLGPWIVLLVAASLTRDVTVVPLIAVLCVAIQTRTRRSALLAATGAASIAPALLVFGNASVRENLAFVFSGSNPPYDASWTFVLRNYWPHFRNLARLDFYYGIGLGWQAPLWYLAILLAVIGAVLLIRSAARGDPFFLLHGYALLGAAVFVALFDEYSALRQELVFLPPVAVGLALLAKSVQDRVRMNANSSKADAAFLPTPLV
jgi:hypothetical protein